MLYLEYEDYKRRCKVTQDKLVEILNEKEALFAMTQIKAVDYGKDRVSGGNGANVFETYMIEKERARIDERLHEARSLLEDRQTLLAAKERELRESTHVEDKIYLYRKVERRRVYWIAKRLNYSQSQVYRILQRIDENLKMRENAS